MLDDGRTVLFTFATESGPDRWDKAQVVVQSLESGERKVVFRGGRMARYAPSGHLAYALAGTLFAIPFNLKALEVQGGLPIAGAQLTAGAGLRGTEGRNYDITPDGKQFLVVMPVSSPQNQPAPQQTQQINVGPKKSSW